MKKIMLKNLKNKCEANESIRKIFNEPFNINSIRKFKIEDRDLLFNEIGEFLLIVDKPLMHRAPIFELLHRSQN